MTTMPSPLPDQQPMLDHLQLATTYSMIVVRPNPNIDYKIVTVTPDPAVDYKMVIVNPNPATEFSNVWNSNSGNAVLQTHGRD